jgi:hypothetical protein
MISFSLRHAGPVSVRLETVFCAGNDPQIKLTMQTTDHLRPQRNDVIDVMGNAGFARETRRFTIQLGNLFWVRPCRRRLSLYGIATRGARIYLTRVGDLIFALYFCNSFWIASSSFDAVSPLILPLLVGIGDIAGALSVGIGEIPVSRAFQYFISVCVRVFFLAGLAVRRSSAGPIRVSVEFRKLLLCTALRARFCFHRCPYSNPSPGGAAKPARN